MVEQINDKNFEQTLQSHNIVVVDFYAVWCGPCKMMHPIIEELAKEHSQIKFVKLDIDDSTSLAISQNVQVVPTFVAYKQGKEINRIIGYNTKEDFELFLKSL